jgi:hypothetical protein
MAAWDIHRSSLETSTELTAYYLPNHPSPLEVIRALDVAKVRFLLIGSHALGGWMQKPRATSDVDVLVGVRSHARAVRALLTAFPHLRAEESQPFVTRLRYPDSESPVIDVMKASQPCPSGRRGKNAFPPRRSA